MNFEFKMKPKAAVLTVLIILTASAYAQNIEFIPAEEYAFGSFERATRIYTGKRGDVYVLDADQNKVYFYPKISESPKIIGGFGWAAGSFDRPTGIATDGVNIYISDYGNHRIQRFDRNLNYISSFSTRDTSAQVDFRFGYPLDVALSDFGDLFVLDGENIRVLKFNPQQFFERSFGDIEGGKGKLQSPVHLAVTTSRIFVSELTRIVEYDYFGNYINSLGEGFISDLTGFVLLENGFIVAEKESLLWLDINGAVQKSMPLANLITSDPITQIQDIAYDGNRIYILSSKKIHIFKTGN